MLLPSLPLCAQTLTVRNEGDLTTLGGWDFNGTNQANVTSINARYNQQYNSYFTAGSSLNTGNVLYGTAFFTGSSGATFAGNRMVQTSNAPIYDLASTVGLLVSNNSLGDNIGTSQARSILLSLSTVADNARAVFKISSANDFNTFSGLNLAYSARNGGTDTAAISWSYSLDGVNFFDIASTSSTIATSGTLYNVFAADLKNITAINGVENLWLGLNYTENTAGASTFLDNVAIYGTAVIVPFTLWDGTSTGNGAQGGDGTWSATSTNWTSAKGTLNRIKTNSSALTPATISHKAVFGGTKGTVTIDAAGVDIKDGIQFTTTDYIISGGQLNTTNSATSIEVSSGATATIASTIAGTGGIDKKDLGTLTLTSANTYTGATAVSAGTLRIDGDQSAATGAVTVASGATLRGSGTTGGAVSLQGGAIIAGTSGQIFTMAGLNLDGSSLINVALGAPSTTELFRVNGNLTLDGTLNVTDAGGFAQGVYRIFNYTGSLSDGGLSIGNSPVLGGLSIQTSVLNQINLVYNASSKNFWRGGNGTWSAAPGSTSWTDSAGTTFGAWQTDFAIFQGTGATVTVDNTSGPVAFTGIQFAGTGYTVTGGTLTNNTANAAFRVGDGSLNDSSKTATIASLITGTGDVEKQGAGTLTLTGNNTYTGTTKVNAGTLLINGNQTAATGTTTVASGGTLGGSGTIGGDVNVGSGGTLNARGTVLGAVTIADGATLRGQSGQLLTTGSLTLNATSHLDLSLGAPSTSSLFQVNGNLTLDGTLNVTNAGAFGYGLYRIFNYTGALTDNGLTFGALPTGIDAGSLTLNTLVAKQVSLLYRDTTTPLPHWTGGSGVWSIAPVHSNWRNVGGSVADSWRPGFAIFQGTSGTVTVDTTAGPVIITGAQFASNGYRVTGGALTTNTSNTTIRVGDGTAAGTSMTATIDSVITGSGGINKTDYGTLVLGGANTYTGGTTVTYGTLQVANDSALGATSGAVTFDGGTLRIGAASFTSSRTFSVGSGGGTVDTGLFDAEWRGAINGTGNLVKSGTGLLTVRNTANSVSSFTGRITISQGGIFLANASSLGTTSILSGARLTGAGSIRGDLSNSGLLSPGASAGTISVTGNYTQNATGTFHVELASANVYDRLAITGTATLGGSLSVASLNNFVPLPGQSFQILTATGGVNGRFATVTTPFDNLSAMLRLQPLYGSNAVSLQLMQLPFADLSGSANQVQLGAGLDGAIEKGKVTGLQAALNALPTQADVALALNQLSPQMYQRWFDQAVYSSGSLVRSVETRMSENQGKPHSGLWSELVSRESRFAGDAYLPETKGKASGILVGADTILGSRARLGLMIGLASEELDLDKSGSNASTERFTAGLYGRVDFAAVFAEAVAGLSYAKQENKRRVLIPGYERTTEASTGSREGFFSLRVGRTFKAARFRVTPYLAGQYVAWAADAMTEYGANDADLRLHAQKRDSTSSRMGVTLSRPVVTSWMLLTPRFDLAWRHEFNGKERDMVADISGSRFAVKTQLKGKDGLVAALGVDAAFGPGVTGYIQLASERSTGVDKSLDGRAGIDIRF